MLLSQRKELRKIVDLRAVARLTEIQGQTYSMFLEGLTISEIARKRNVSRQSVSDAMNQIVKILSKEDN
jgi:predicted DNA-binding protein YlxM (UPF0122 family)